MTANPIETQSNTILDKFKLIWRSALKSYEINVKILISIYFINIYVFTSALRLENHQGTIHYSYIIGKSRVPPLKLITIPRLELAAASVAVRIDKMLKSELQVPIDKIVF